MRVQILDPSTGSVVTDKRTGNFFFIKKNLSHNNQKFFKGGGNLFYYMKKGRCKAESKAAAASGGKSGADLQGRQSWMPIEKTKGDFTSGGFWPYAGSDMKRNICGSNLKPSILKNSRFSNFQAQAIFLQTEHFPQVATAKTKQKHQ